MMTPDEHLSLVSSFSSLICSFAIWSMLCNSPLNPEYYLLFLHQLLFGSAEPSLHPVACDGTCWTNCIHKVQSQCSGVPFSPPLPPHHHHYRIQPLTPSNTEKTCQRVWLCVPSMHVWSGRTCCDASQVCMCVCV